MFLLVFAMNQTLLGAEDVTVNKIGQILCPPSPSVWGGCGVGNKRNIKLCSMLNSDKDFSTFYHHCFLSPDTSRIYVALGYGFFLELTLAEALKFIDRKSNLLTE